MSFGALSVQAKGTTKSTYEEALDLVHAYNGSGDELRQAFQLADELYKADPNSGYAQVIYAEVLSTWELGQDGKPLDVRDQVLVIADEALKLNPRLAQAHVSKARALVRSSMYPQAESSVADALAIDPTLGGAMFIRAEIFRRQGSLVEAELWYNKFITSVSSPDRKANGYSWIASMYLAATYFDPNNRKDHIAKARSAYESSLKYDADGPWRNVNFAIFLNDYAADFETAEIYAQKALKIMEFPMARYHLAAARYQKLAVANMQRLELATAVGEVASGTGVSLDDAIAFRSFSPVIRERLQSVQARLAAR